MANDYLQMMEAEEAGSDARFQASTGQALSVNADQAAAARRVAGYLGVPPAVVEAAPEDAQRQAQQKALNFNTAQAPTLRQRYTDADFAKLAHDDSDSLSAAEKLLRAAGDVAKYAASTPDALGGGLIGDARRLLSGAPMAGAGLYGAAAAPFELLGQAGVPGMSHIGGFFRDQQQQSEGAARAWAPELGADATLTERGFQSGLQSAGQNLVTLPAGILTRSQAALLGIMGIVTGGQSYGKARDAKLSPAQAIPFAVEDATAEVVTERFLGAAGFLKLVQAGAPAGRMFMYEIAKEVPGEIAATLWQNFNEWTNVNPSKSMGDFLAEQPAAIAETVIATLVGGTAQIGAVKSIEHSFMRAGEQDRQVEDAQRYADMMGKLLDIASGSKLRGRDAATFGDFVQQAAEEAGHDGRAYVDAATLVDVLNQAGVSLEQFAALSPTAAEELMPAAQSGGTVAIPVGDLAGPLAQTGVEQHLLPHLRATEDSLSQEEAKLATAQAQELLKQEADRLVQQAGDIAAVAASTAAVQQQMLQQLTTANRFTADVNEAYARLVSSFYTAVSRRFGVTPEELYGRYPLRVQAVRPEGGFVEQSIPDVAALERKVAEAQKRLDERRAKLTDGHPLISVGERTLKAAQAELHAAKAKRADFDKWFGASKVVDTQGRPLVVYHGGGPSITAFRRSSGGRAIWATSSPDTAASYSGTAEGATVYPVFLSMANPLEFDAQGATWQHLEFEGQRVSTDDIASIAEERGYDGVVIRNLRDDNVDDGGDTPSDHYAVFEPTRVKSATGNSGRFNTNDPNIVNQDAAAQMIQVDGKWHPIHDANGRPVGRTFTEQQNFWKWFGDSKVVDASGKPLVVYHGTGKNFETFKGPRIYFSPDAKYASNYADWGYGEDNVIPAYLSLKNPLDLTEFGHGEVSRDSFFAALQAAGVTPPTEAPHGLPVWAWMQTEGVIDAIKAAGYDGVAQREESGAGRAMAYIAFDSEQIKSAIGNDGSYDTNDPSVLSQSTKKREAALKKWFGKSKIVDDNGKPLVMYHGTSSDISEFDVGKAGENTVGTASEGSFGPGVYVTQLPWHANLYAGQAWGKASGANVMPLYVKMEKPFIFDGTKEKLFGGNTVHPLEARWWEHDYDGAVIYRPGINGQKWEIIEAVVRSPEQLKSAIGNDGTFDASDRSVLSQGPRGTFSPSSLTISLLEKADLSTFLHETGHFFLEALSDMAAQQEAPADITKDMLTVLEWFGVRTLEEWHAMSLDEQRPYHEKFAESFEQYLFEGNAPSRELGSLFGRFRAWLTNVYRSLQSFMASYNTQLSDEVRGVFGRLIATQEEIEQAEADSGFASMLDAFDGKVDPALLEHYKRLTTEASEEAMAKLQSRSLRDLRWVVNARSRELRRLSKDVDKKREAVAKEVTAEVDATPEMRAAARLEEIMRASPEVRDARKDWRDRRAAALERAQEQVKAKYNADADAQGLKGLQKGQFQAKNRKTMKHEVDGLMLDWEKENPFPKRPTVTNVPLDAIAEEFGFTSGDHMLRAIDAYGPRDVAIEGITNQRMLERHGELVTAGGLQRAANEAVHNEARARAVAAELQALQSAVSAKEETGKTITAKRKDGTKVQYQQTTNVIVQAARRFAENLVARRKVRELRANQHQAAERRAAKAALEAAAAGKSQEAMVAKRDQLLNFYAAKETMSAIDEIERGVKYLRKVGDSETLDPDYRDQIAVMLERFDLKPASNKALERRATLLQWVEEQRDMGVEPEIPPELLDEAQRRSYRDMTVEEFRGLVDTVKQIEHLGRLKHKLLTAKDEREFAAVVDTITAQIIDAGGKRTIENATPNTELGKKLLGLQKFAAQHVKAATWARIMDGGKDGGPVWEYIIRAANVAGNQEVEMRATATRELSELVAPLMDDGKMDAKTFIPEINGSLNRQARIAVALNMGNEGNLQRLMGGHNWTAEQVQAIGRTLTETEWRFVQKVWDYFDSYRPLVGAKEKRVSGVEPKWVEPVAFEVQVHDDKGTPKTVKLRGGYYPVKYDPEASHRAEQHADAEGARQQMRGAYTSATTRRSFTKSRVDEVRGRPLLLSLDGVYQGINEVIHDLSWHEFLIDANRLVGNDKIAAAMRQKFGAGAHQQFKSWLQDVARGETNVVGEGFAGWLRSGVSISGLGFNIMSAAIQPLGITQSITRVGAKWIGRGVARYAGAPIDTTRDVHEKSSFMRHRAQTRLRELAEVQAQIQGRSKVREAVDVGAYYMMLQAQQAVDVPTWVGAYEKAVVEGGFGEDEAVQLADQAVIDAQGSGMLKDQAAIERGGQMKKLLTVFYSFFNTTLNNLVLQTSVETNRAKLAADYLLLAVVPAVLGAMLRDALTPGDSGDWDDWRKMAKRMIGEEISYLMSLMVGVREFSNAAQAVTGTAKYGTDYSGPAGTRMIGDVTKLGVQANQGELDPAFRKALVNVAGELMRLPSAQINRSITGFEALRDGKTKNPLALVAGYQEPSH